MIDILIAILLLIIALVLIICVVCVVKNQHKQFTEEDMLDLEWKLGLSEKQVEQLKKEMQNRQ